MAKQQVVTVTDDIDGREGAQTVSFAYAGRTYEIDLGEKNRAKLEKALEPFIGAARRANGTSTARRAASKSLNNNAVREWARGQGMDVSARGRLSKSVVEAYQAAH